MNFWAHYNPVKVIFGEGCRSTLINHIKNKKSLIVTTSRGKEQLLNDSKLSDILTNNYLIDSVTSNPEIDLIQKEIDYFKKSSFSIDNVIAFGGGSAIDTAKSINFCISSKESDPKLISIIKNPSHFSNNYLKPLYAIPTTAGTGSEVTQFSTVWDKKNKKKLSLTHKNIFPEMALVDPELTYGLPYLATISTGLDALNQAFESIWNKNKTPISAYTASKSIGKSLKGLKLLNEDLNDKKARLMISEASLLAGISISQTRTAICHSISYPLTSNYQIPHGFACAFTMNTIARMVVDFNPNYFNEVIAFNKIKSVHHLLKQIEDLLDTLKVREINRKLLKSKDNLLSIRNEMLSPERSNNFVLPINQENLVFILNKSFGD